MTRIADSGPSPSKVVLQRNGTTGKYEIVQGTSFSTVTTSTVTAAASDVLRLVVVDTTATAYVNGTQVATGTVAAVTSSTGTQHGVQVYDGTVTYDNVTVK